MASLMHSPFEQTPNEILSGILLVVKRTSGSSSLLQCLLCCKTWHGVTKPILYRDIHLTNSNLKPFLQPYDNSHYPLLRSLTVTIDPIQPGQTDKDEDRIKRCGSQNTTALWHLLQQLTERIPSMVRMTAFSLAVSTETYARGFWIPKSSIAAILKALPEACVSVELDTRDYEEPAPTPVHLCDSLRAILPRLQHLRLSLPTMCPAVFTNDYSPRVCIKRQSPLKPVVAPFLETFIVNCLPGPIPSSDQTILCNHCWRSDWMLDYSREFAATIVDALCFAKDTISFPAAERISVLHTGSSGTSLSLNRRNILEATTWAMPFGAIAIRKTDQHFIRTLEDEELVADSWTIKALAEGEIWVETMDGCRLPAPMLEKSSSAYTKKNLQFVDADTWKTSNPTVKCSLWRKEKRCRTRLLAAEYREGFSDLRRVGDSSDSE